MLLKCYRTLVDKYLSMFLVCKKLFQPHYSLLFIRVDLDSREFSSTMLPMCSDIFIRSTIYLLGVWRNRRSSIYISTLCQYLYILTVTKFAEMNRVVGRSVCTLLTQGRNFNPPTHKLSRHILEDFQDLSGSLLHLAAAFRLPPLSVMKQCPCPAKTRSYLGNCFL